MEVAIQKGLKICAHPVLKTELENAHPTADFIFSDSGNKYYGVLDNYDAKECQVMAVSGFDTRNNIELMNMFCKRDLVFTKSVFMKTVSSSSYLLYRIVIVVFLAAACDATWRRR